MNTKTNSIILLGLIVIALAGCVQPTPEENQTHKHADTSHAGFLLADTIIYDVIIKNPDPEDTWSTQRLQRLDHKNLIDSLFQLVYSGEVTAFDFFSKKELSISDVKQLESADDFDRAKIGKIQFTEKWLLDPQAQQFNKQVISVVLGYELYNDEGYVRGYRPVFKLHLQ